MDMIKYSSLRSPVICIHSNCDLKNFQPRYEKYIDVYQLKRCYIGFLNTIEIDVDAYQISFNCDIKISHFAVY